MVGWDKLGLELALKWGNITPKYPLVSKNQEMKQKYYNKL